MIAFARPWSLKGWNTYALAATSCSLLSPWGVPEGTPVGLFHAASFLGWPRTPSTSVAGQANCPYPCLLPKQLRGLEVRAPQSRSAPVPVEENPAWETTWHSSPVSGDTVRCRGSSLG